MRRTDRRQINMRSLMALILAIMLAVPLLTGCSTNGAEAQTEQDLESLRSFELDDKTVEGLSGMLDDTASEYFDGFMTKVRDFDYKIEDSSKSESDGSTIVRVRITTYSFGREYLSTWTEYLQKNKDSEFDEAAFYEMLMKNLSELELKSYDSYVDILCKESDSGEWTTNASTDMTVRDAILGGLITEIAAVADIGS